MLVKTHNRLEFQIQKHVEIEERINLVTEENKTMAIQLSQSQRENTKLRKKVSHLEEKLASCLSENIEKVTRLEEITNKFTKLSGLYNDTKKLLDLERDHFKLKETERENTWREVIIENRDLQSQLDSNISYTEEIKYKLKAALEELSNIQSPRIKNVMEADSSSGLLISANPELLPDENFSVDHTITSETSLLAELKDKLEPNKRECCCVCKQNVLLNPLFFVSVDAAVGTDNVDKATMTPFYTLAKCNSCSNIEHKDIGVECSFKKITEALSDSNSITHCGVKSRRSNKKWAFLFGMIFILFLSLLLMYLFVHISLSSNVRRSHKPILYFTPFFNMLGVHVKILDIFLPIK